MKRAGIYARYSSELQDGRSIDDQVRLCVERAGAENWTVTETWTDAAITGTRTQRPGYQAMLADCERGAIDIVLAESLDRLSRNQAETARLHEVLTYHGIKIVTLHDGEVTEILAGLKGTMNALFIKDLGAKTKRGQSGRHAAGKIPGGNAYGYRPVRDGTGEAGDRVIVEDQAVVVRRIFTEYATGRSPKAIARDLNAEGVPGPTGVAWSQSTMNGNRRRGNGILNNELYRGCIVWNRQSFVRDPRTGKRQARPNPEDQWKRSDVPHLRIIDDDLWNAVKARQELVTREWTEWLNAPMQDPNKGRPGPNLAKRPASLLTGLIRCGSCGGRAAVVSSGGRRGDADAPRVGCVARRTQGTCDNSRTIKRTVLERMVLDGLKDRMLAPDLVEEFVAAYTKEMNVITAEHRAERRSAEQRIERIGAKIRTVVEAISEGYATTEMKQEMMRLDDERRRLTVLLESEPEPMPAIHSNIARVYRNRVAKLEQALESPTTHATAQEAIRDLVSEIRLIPGEKRGEVHVEIFGELAAILDLAADRTRSATPATGSRDVVVQLVAGARNQRYLQLGCASL